MNTLQVLQITQIVLSISLVVVIMMQQGGGGLGTVFGGGGGESYRSKRGMEAMLFRATVLLVVLFVVNALAIVIISSK